MARNKDAADTTTAETAKDIVDEEFAGLSGPVEDPEEDDLDDEDDEEEDLVDDDEVVDEDEPIEGDDLDDLARGQEEAAAAGAGADRGDGRDDKGKFATKAEKDAADAKVAADAAAAAKPADTAASGTAAPAATEKPAGSAAAPKFEPLKIKAEKEDVDIPEAQITRADGHVILGVKEAEWGRFQQRLSRGIVAEKVWHRLTQKERELDAERSAPPRRSDADIEAEMLLEVLKPHLAELLTPIEVENLDLKIEKAKRAYADTYAADRKTHIDKAMAPPVDGQAEILQGLATHLISFRDDDQFKDVTDDELRRAYADLAPYQRSVFWKEGEETFANNQLIAQRLTAIKQGRTTKQVETGAPPANGNTATTTDTSAASAATAAGERFNRGVDTSGKPSTTSLSAQRGKKPARPRDERNTRRDSSTREREPVANPKLDAEEDWRAKSRKFLNSPGLDFDDE